MADESTELLRQLLAVQKEILGELKKEAERTEHFREQAIEQGNVSQKKMNIFSTFMFLIILFGLAYALFRQYF